MDHQEPVNNNNLENPQTPVPEITTDEVPNSIVNDVPLPEAPVDEVPEGAFEPSTVLDLPGMSSETLAKIEAQLANEFASLSREFVEARKPRIEYLLKRIDQLIADAENHDREWNQICSSKIKQIEAVFTAPEHYLLGTSKEEPNEEDLKSLISQVIAPLDLDDIAARNDELPYSVFFKKIIRPYETQLDALHNQYIYQSALINQNVERNQSIIWKQYLQDILDMRNELIDKTYLELTSLYEEFHDIRPGKVAASEWNHYYRSVVPSGDIPEEKFQQVRLKRGNIDSYYDIDNRYFKKNKIKLTKAKMDVLEGLSEFEAKQRGHDVPQRDDIIVNLTSCAGLTQDEVDDDLGLLRACTRKPASYKNSRQNSDDMQSETNLEFEKKVQLTEDEHRSPSVMPDAAAAVLTG